MSTGTVKPPRSISAACVAPHDNFVYLFSGSECWQYDPVNNFLSSGFPRAVALVWPKAPNNILAAVTRDKELFLLKGEEVWQYNGTRESEGFPKRLSAVFAVPEGFRCGFYCAREQKYFWFRGEEYWQGSSPGELDAGFPKPVSSKWPGAPASFEAAVERSGELYFISRGKGGINVVHYGSDGRSEYVIAVGGGNPPTGRPSSLSMSQTPTASSAPAAEGGLPTPAPSHSPPVTVPAPALSSTPPDVTSPVASATGSPRTFSDTPGPPPKAAKAVETPVKAAAGSVKSDGEVDEGGLATSGSDADAVLTGEQRTGEEITEEPTDEASDGDSDGEGTKIKDEKKGKQVNFILGEIVASELTYTENMNRLFGGYESPMRESQLFSQADMNALFASIKPVAGTNQELLKKLQAATAPGAAAPPVGVARAFTEMAPFLKMYGDFAANHPKAVEVADELNSSKKTQAFLKQCAESTGEDLRSHLIKPIQRICKYPLFFKDLLRNIPPDYTDRHLIEEAESECDKIAQMINEKKREAENTMKILELQRRLEIELLQAARWYLMEGKFTEVTSEGPGEMLFFYLFNDCIVLARPGRFLKDRIHHKATMLLIDITVSKDTEKRLLLENTENSFLVELDSAAVRDAFAHTVTMQKISQQQKASARGERDSPSDKKEGKGKGKNGIFGTLRRNFSNTSEKQLRSGGSEDSLDQSGGFAATDDASKASCEGKVSCRDDNGKWHERYLVLEGTMLFQYKKREGHIRKDTPILRENIAGREFGLCSDKKKKFTFFVKEQRTQNTDIIAAGSEEEALRWVFALSLASPPRSSATPPSTPGGSTPSGPRATVPGDTRAKPEDGAAVDKGPPGPRATVGGLQREDSRRPMSTYQSGNGPAPFSPPTSPAAAPMVPQVRNRAGSNSPAPGGVPAPRPGRKGLSASASDNCPGSPLAADVGEMARRREAARSVLSNVIGDINAEATALPNSALVAGFVRLQAAARALADLLDADLPAENGRTDADPATPAGADTSLGGSGDLPPPIPPRGPDKQPSSPMLPSSPTPLPPAPAPASPAPAVNGTSRTPAGPSENGTAVVEEAPKTDDGADGKADDRVDRVDSAGMPPRRGEGTASVTSLGGDGTAPAAATGEDGAVRGAAPAKARKPQLAGLLGRSSTPAAT